MADPGQSPGTQNQIKTTVKQSIFTETYKIPFIGWLIIVTVVAMGIWFLDTAVGSQPAFIFAFLLVLLEGIAIYKG